MTESQGLACAPLPILAQLQALQNILVCHCSTSPSSVHVQDAALRLAAEHLKPQQALLLARTLLTQPVVSGLQQAREFKRDGCPN
jgi:hypothetical protein